MTWKPKHPSWLAGAIGGLLCMQLASAQTVEDLFDAGETRIQQAQAQQEEVEAIVEVTEDQFLDYLSVLREIEDLELYNRLLQAQVDGQNRELNTLYTSIDNVGVIERQILPLMTRMNAALRRFIELDMPFFVEERLARVERAEALLLRSDVTVANQFLFVLEGWLIEMDDYGAAGDVYTDQIMTADGVMREVEVLRIGRIALLYVTPDGSTAGAWDRSAQRWVALDQSLAQDIRIGIDSYESGQPSLFVAPVPAPEER